MAANDAGNADSFDDAIAASLPEGFQCRLYHLSTPSKRCDPLFSPPPGRDPERTRLSSHFLAVSITHDHPNEGRKEILVFAIEVLIYTTQRLTTVFVSKADSTGYLLLTNPPKASQSPVRAIAGAYVQWLVRRQKHKHPARALVVSLFARAQDQYLFPGSADNKGKHVLDDRQLIRWWAKTLGPLFQDVQGIEEEIKGYITVPGFDRYETLRSFAPPDASKRFWSAGNPLLELAGTRSVSEAAPPRSLLPRFPDDPKARFVQELDDEVGFAEETATSTSPSKSKGGQWKSVRTLDNFWEAMEFRQECSSGRCVGFLWVVFPPSTSGPDSQLEPECDSQASSAVPAAISLANGRSSALSSPKKTKRKPLTGPIVPRQPRLKLGSSGLSATSILDTSHPMHGEVSLTKEGYDRSMQTLLHLDFENQDVATKSSNKWINEIATISGHTGNTGVSVSGKKRLTVPAVSAAVNAANGTNDLTGMVRKKRKADDPAPAAEPEKPAVNVLGASMVRKKPKAVT